MAGGLLNFVSHGQENIYIYGNPQKTFFKTTYKHISNFGIQKFRIDYQGSRNLRLNDETNMIFKIPRYADLLKDTCVVINLPDIWSPLYFNTTSNEWVETEFKWTKELGSTMIKEVEISSGGQLLASYSGEYFSCLHQRDSNSEKRELWDRMTGNIPALNDPANAYGRVNIYPSVYNHTPSLGSVRPSINGRQLYIPIDAFYSTNPGMAFPLVSLQYSELQISVTFRPISELYMIREVTNIADNYPYVAPNQNVPTQQFTNFINQPIDASGNTISSNTSWNTDIHLMCSYVFLDNDERKFFAKNEQKYLIKDVYIRDFPNLANSSSVEFKSHGLVCNYMFRFRRNDAFLRNEWSNYTNWAYDSLPYQVTNISSPEQSIFITGYSSGQLLNANMKDILVNMGILLDGKYRENILNGGVYNYIEKYLNTAGGAKDGLYLYTFELNTDNKVYQPSGAINMDKFENITFEILTINPPYDPNASFIQLCDPTTGNVIGTQKNIWNVKQYSFDLRVFEEKYNILHFSNGLCGLKYAR